MKILRFSNCTLYTFLIFNHYCYIVTSFLPFHEGYWTKHPLLRNIIPGCYHLISDVKEFWKFAMPPIILFTCPARHRGFLALDTFGEPNLPIAGWQMTRLRKMWIFISKFESKYHLYSFARLHDSQGCKFHILKTMLQFFLSSVTMQSTTNKSKLRRTENPG